jgi:hypothetical protein
MRMETAIMILRAIMIFISGMLFALFLQQAAQAQVACTREMFTSCHVGTQVPFTYTDNVGVIRSERITRRVGCLREGLPTCSLSLMRIDADSIPTASLAAEHNWMIVQLEQRAQKEVAECFNVYEEYQKLLRESCLIRNKTCSPMANTIVNIQDYWIEFNAVENTSWWTINPPTREEWLTHFKLGAFGSDGNPATPDSGLDQFLALRDWCKTVAVPQIKQKARSKGVIR